ncbi:MAG TPA: TlpA disulfide reductase family protein [Steroidobacteraceae bacterium]|nr:TlpA disulfide reductase family protein [Steroidobacteraceae bacterium]
MHFRSRCRDRFTNHVKWDVMKAILPSSRPRGADLRLLPVLVLAVLGLCSAAVAAPQSLIGQGAPDFALAAYAGENVRLSESLGEPVIIAFWGTNCSVCAAQLARLDRLYQTYRSSGLVVLAISVDDDMQRADRYAHAHRMHFPLLLDPSKEVSRAYQIDRLPTTVLIDRSGVIRYLHDAYRANDPSYVVQIRALLDDEDSLRSTSVLTH